jgi:NarL family two-component system response regulator LiaR
LTSTSRTMDLGKTTKIRLLIADDHPLVRLALRSVLEKHDDFEIIAEAGDGQEAINLAKELNPDIVIMDISMPEVSGLEATRQIKMDCPETSVLVLTVHTDNEHILGILEAGASAYLTKRVFGDEIIHTIRALAVGETVLSPTVWQQVLKYVSRRIAKPLQINATDKMTPKELEILGLLAKGISNKDIANELGVSVRTIKSHLADLFLKLHVSSRTEAVIVSLRSGIISPDDLA